MAKLSKEEFKEKIDAYDGIPEETKISLLEDIEDSIDVIEEPQINEYEEKYNDLQMQYNDLREKYKSRFFEKVDEKVVVEDKIIEPQEEKHYIDIREI